MSKLAHSHQPTMDKIEAARLAREGIYKAPWSGSDPSCPECDGEGIVYGEPSR